MARLGKKWLIAGTVALLCSSLFAWTVLSVPAKRGPPVVWNGARADDKAAGPRWLAADQPETNAEAAEAVRQGSADPSDALRALSEWTKLQRRGAARGGLDPLGRLVGDALEALGLRRPQPLYRGAGRAQKDECAALLKVPKVALLFLTRGVMHHERTWDLWFRNARGLLPLAAVKGTGCAKSTLEALAGVCNPPGGAPGGPIQQQHLATVYLHVGLNEEGFQGFAPGSLFHGLDIRERIHVEWGTFSLVEATRALFRAALQDAANAKFMLLSESGIPLYPLQTLWVEVMWEAKSRIAACAATNEADRYKLNLHRWIPEMEADAGITQEVWRKSGQWITLTRKHVELAANDTVVADAFVKHCFVEWVEWQTPKLFRDCYCDEHYFGTLLALHGVEGETDCKGETVHVTWPGGGQAHPTTWTKEWITPERFKEMRQTAPAPQCDSQAAVATAAKQFVNASQLAAGPALCKAPTVPFSGTLGSNCTLAARKFAPDAAEAVTEVLADCRNGLYVLNSEEDCRLEAQRAGPGGRAAENPG